MPRLRKGGTLAKTLDFLVHMFRGDIELARMFWVYGFLALFLWLLGIMVVGVAVTYACWWVVSGIQGHVGYSLEFLCVLPIFVFWAGLIAYYVLVHIAVWRSAAKYKGLILWRFLAQAYVVCITIYWLRELYAWAVS